MPYSDGVGNLQISNKRALLLGSSFSALPILQILRRKGIHVTVCGNNVHDPCVKESDAFLQMDYSSLEDVLGLCRKEKFDFIIPSCNDAAYWTGTIVANELNLPGFDKVENIKTLHSKNKFRELCSSLNLRVPAFINFNKISDLEDRLSELVFPILLKPIRKHSGIGIFKATTRSELDKILLVNNDWEGYIAESYLEGTLHSHSAFVQNGKIVNQYFADEFCNTYPYQVDCSNYPSRINQIAQEDVTKQINRIIEFLQISDGLIHTQFIIHEGYAFLIETMRRCPGDLFPEMIQLSTGSEYLVNYINPFINQKIEQDHNEIPNKSIARHTISTTLESFVNFFRVDTHKMNNLTIYPLKTSGVRMQAAPNDKAAVIFMEVESEKDLFELTPNINSKVMIYNQELKLDGASIA